jgi:hypothetical protein
MYVGMNITQMAKRIAIINITDPERATLPSAPSNKIPSDDFWLEESQFMSNESSAIKNAVENISSTTKAFLVIAEWLDTINDGKGASMVKEFAKKFAIHEAGVI